MQNHAMKVKLDPTPRQERYLFQCLGFARLAYNFSLAKVKDDIKHGVKPELSFYSMRKHFNNTKKELFPWYFLYSKEISANAIANLANGFKKFYSSKGKCKVGFPKFKNKRNNCGSFTITCYDPITDDYHIRIPKLKSPIHCFENLNKRRKDYIAKNTTISYDGTNWCVSIGLEREVKPVNNQKEDFVGIDLGLLNLATLSDGSLIENNRYLVSSENKLKKKQKQLSRKQGFLKGQKQSNRYKKKKRELNKLNKKIANQRRDYIEKITTEICRTYKNIAIEDLHIQNMQKNHKLAKSLSDASLAMFRSCLERKANEYCNNIFIIDQFYPSSKTCSSCGHVKTKLDLSERTYICEKCGVEINRDFNAALNLENIARQFVARSTQETLNAHRENVRLVSLRDIKQISVKCESGKTVRPEVFIGNDKIANKLQQAVCERKILPLSMVSILNKSLK